MLTILLTLIAAPIILAAAVFLIAIIFWTFVRVTFSLALTLFILYLISFLTQKF
jgi:hypothetical protein